jgi:hypothetical protein
MSIRDDQTISVSRDQIKIVAGKNHLTVEQTKELIQALLLFVLEQTVLEVEAFITKIVPVRTGELRNDLLLKLRHSKVQNFVLTIFLWSELPYAERVNRMSTYQVRHTGTWYENPNRRGYRARARDKYGTFVYLNDPTAQGNYFDKLVDFTRDRLMVNLARGKMMIAQGSQLTVRGMSAIG